MKSLTVTAKTTLVSSLLALLFLSGGGVVLDNVVQIMVKNSADSTLRSQLNALSATIEGITIENVGDALDPLSPGQLAVVRNHSGLILLNSFAKLPNQSVLPFHSLTPNKLENFSLNGQEYWGIRAFLPGPDGLWEVVVSQNNQLSHLFTRKVIFLLFGFGGFLIFAIWAGSLFLSRYLLRPVKRMRTRAEEMIKNQQRGTLPVSTADDEISRLAKTLNQLLNALHESLDRQSQLIADVSHELRTPLAVLQTRLQLAISSEDREEQKVELSKMFVNSMALTNLLNQILSLARNPIAASRQISTPDQVKSLLLMCIDSMRLLASRKSVSIVCSLELNHPVQVSFDGLERTINNLLANSLASVEIGGSICVSVSQTAEQTLLVVEDSGKGFDPEFIPKALERFSRADSSRSRERGGFGLGLSLVKVILDSCEGQIAISNRESEPGARVVITLKNVTESSHRNP